MEARCLDALSGVVQYNPQVCLAKFYGLGCWGWAVVGSDRWGVKKLIRLCQEAWAQPVSLERRGQRNNKNSATQTYEGRLFIYL